MKAIRTKRDPFPLIDKNKIYDILILYCGAHSDWRSMFLKSFPDCVEWRFQGKLGFGGKIWWNSEELYVNCYKEDETIERLEIMAFVNFKLNELLK